MARFVKNFETFKNLPEKIVKKFLFAMSYSIDDEDEIDEVGAEFEVLK